MHLSTRSVNSMAGFPHRDDHRNRSWTKTCRFRFPDSCRNAIQGPGPREKIRAVYESAHCSRQSCMPHANTCEAIRRNLSVSEGCLHCAADSLRTGEEPGVSLVIKHQKLENHNCSQTINCGTVPFFSSPFHCCHGIHRNGSSRGWFCETCRPVELLTVRSFVLVQRLILLFPSLLSIPLARQGCLDAALLAGLQVVGVTLDFLDDVLLLHLPLETA
jgi:hypothetical protein